MALTDEDLDRIAERVWSYKLEASDTDPPKSYRASWFLTRIHDLSRALKPDPTPKKTPTKKVATKKVAVSKKKVATPKPK